jgi:hypothetical protein
MPALTRSAHETSTIRLNIDLERNGGTGPFLQLLFSKNTQSKQMVDAVLSRLDSLRAAP